MPERRARRHPGAARGLAHADRFRAALPDQLQRGLDQGAPEIAVMIGLWRRRGRRAGRRRGLADTGMAWSSITES